MAEWADELLEEEGLKQGSREDYHRRAARFEKWYERMGRAAMGGRDWVDADEDIWLLYAAHESTFTSHSTIEKTLVAVRHACKLRYGFDPLRSTRYGTPRAMLRLERVMRGIKLRESGGGKRRKKLSVTRFLLKELVNEFDAGDYNDVLLWAMLCVGVGCLLRWSEVGWTGRESKLVRREDVEVLAEGRGFRLQLRDTKTMLFGDEMVVTGYADGTSTCGTSALVKFLGIRKRGEALFTKKNGRPLSARTAQKWLVEKMTKAGKDPKTWAKGTSLRRGGALTLALSGVPDRVIRGMGRWRSYAYRIYIELTEEEKVSWADAVKGTLAGTRRRRDKVKLEEVMDRAC